MRHRVVLAIAAAAGFAACGTDEPLSFDLGIDQTRLTAGSQEFPVWVAFGCKDEDARIEGYEVEYTSTEVTVTFRGSVSYEVGDCDDREERQVVLDGPLGNRRLCDGSADPPTLVWPRPAGLPDDAVVGQRCS